MKESEASASVRVLLFVALADGTPLNEKTQAIEVVAGALGASALDAMSEAIDLEAELSRLKSPALARRTLRAALAIAEGGGSRTRAVVDRVRAWLEPLAHGAVLNASGLRGALDGATDEFLHEVGRMAGKGELSSGSYETLVRDLQSKKRALLQRALVSLPPPR
jgi:tellurite resistance protein